MLEKFGNIKSSTVSSSSLKFPPEDEDGQNS